MSSRGRRLEIEPQDNNWGTHLCILYETPEQLTNTLVSFFKQGLRSNESCLWITSNPSETKRAVVALKDAIEDIQHLQENGQIEILESSAFGFKSKQTSAADFRSALIQKEQVAEKNGYEGLRVSGNIFRLGCKNWPLTDNIDLDQIIQGRRITIACPYCPGNAVPELRNITTSQRLIIAGRSDNGITYEKINDTLKALQVSEARFRLFVENSHEGITVSCDDKIQFVNTKTLELSGYDEEEIIGKSIRDFIHPDERELTLERYEQRLKGGPSPSKITTRVINKKGESIWIEANAVRILWEGRPAVLSFSNDITDRKKAEEGLRQSEEKMRAIFESSADGIILIDLHGKILDLNKAALDIHGATSKEEVIGQNGFMHLVPEDLSRAADDLKDVIEGGGQGVKEHTFIRKDGSQYKGESHTSLVRDLTGKPVSIITVLRDVTERKKGEEALRKSEHEYRLLVDNAKESIVVLCEGYIRFVNKRCKDMMGYTPEEMISKPFSDYLRPQDLQNAFELYDRTIKNEPFPEGYSIIAVAKSGENKWLEVNSVLISWEGKPATLNFVTDITERKKAEESLRRSNQRFRDLVESLPEPIYEINLDGKFSFGNQAAFKLTGYTRADLDRGIDALDLCIPEERAMIKQHLLDVFSGKDLETKEYFIRRKDGSIFPAILQAVPIRDGDKIVGLRGIVRDITERKKAEEALKKSESEYRLLIENANELIVVVSDGIIRFANPKCEEVTRYTKEEIISRPFSDFIHPDDVEKAVELYGMKVRGEKTPDNYSLRIIDKYGEIKWLESNQVLVAWEGRPATMTFLSEITERKRAEDALRKSESEYRLLVENANDAILVICEGTLRYFNSRVEEGTGYTKEELMLKPFIDLVHPDDRSLMLEKMARRLSGEPYPGEYLIRILRKDGGIRWTEPKGVLISWNDQPAILVFAPDATERKKAQDALRKSESEYRLLVENANEAVVVACGETMKFANRKASEISGYSLDEILSMNYLDFIHPEDRARALEQSSQRMKETKHDLVNLRVLTKNNEVKWLQVDGVDIVWEGEPATLNFMIDITDRRKAEQEVKRSRAELRRLSAYLQTLMEIERKHIAHEIHDELGQQLTALKMDLSWIGKNLHKDEQQLTDKIKAMSGYIDTTIQTVRKISTDLRPALLDDFGLLAAIESQSGEFERRTGITCVISPRSVEVDLGQERNVAIFRIFQEALTNVARHAGATRVDISLTQNNGKVLLLIRDNGRGAKEGELASSQSIGIVGMRERARLCKGQMRITGIEGKGTTVRVSIPIQEDKADA